MTEAADCPKMKSETHHPFITHVSGSSIAVFLGFSRFFMPISPAIFHASEEKEIRSGHLGRTGRARHSQSHEKYIHAD
jgi:hypothetical protein